MNWGDILVTLYKVGTQIRVGLGLFDRIVVTAKEAAELVQKEDWEDHPIKAQFVALPDDKQKEADKNGLKPDGIGRLTCISEFDHQAHIDEQESAPKAPPLNQQTKAPEGGETLKPNKAQVKSPAKGKKPPKTKQPNKPEPLQPEDVAKNDDKSGSGVADKGDTEKDDDGDSSKE